MTERPDYWPHRYKLVGLCFAATFVCYIDRGNISVIPMAEQFGWDETTKASCCRRSLSAT